MIGLPAQALPRLGSLCSGYGGLDLAAEAVLGPLRHAWHAEIDPHASQVLAHHWPTTPNLGDITAVDFAALPAVDVLTAGFPCQDVSAAGKRAGLKPGTRTGIWSHVAHAIKTLQPRLLLLENVKGLLSADAHSDVEPCPWCLGDTGAEPVVRALGAVLADLADLGFDAEWTTVPACRIGAPHERERVFVVAWPQGTPPDASALTRRVGAPAVAVDGLTLLPTPTASDAGNGPGRATTAQGSLNLRTVAALFPTPVAADGGGGRGSASGYGLRDAVRTVPADWGIYAEAVDQWERIIGRSAPAPTVRGVRGGRWLSPHFVEWMMGLPQGWVCDRLPIDVTAGREAAVRMLGNGVVPQQAAHAYAELLGSLRLAVAA